MDATNYLIQLIFGYKISNVLFLASEYNLFSFLKDKQKAKDIAVQLNIDHRALVIILDTLVAYRILAKCEDDIYCINDDFYSLLNPESNTNMLHLLVLEHFLSDNHTTKNALRDSITYGLGSNAFNENAKEHLESTYSKAMDHGSRLAGIYIAREFQYCSTPSMQVMDLGGGSGSYAVSLCKMNENVNVDVYDKEEMRPLCMELVRQNQLEDRIHFWSRDVRYGKFETVYDGIIISNLMHLLDSETNRKVLTRSAESLKHKGRIVLHDFFLDDSKTGPLIPSLFTLDWLMQGSFFHCNVKDISCWLRAVGLEIVGVKQYKKIPTSIIVAEKE